MAIGPIVPGWRNVWILITAQGLLSAVMAMSLLVSGILGEALAPTPALATLPISAAIAGTAFGVLPAVRILSWLGRRWGSIVGAVISCGAALCAAAALFHNAFWFYVISHLLIGFGTVFVNQYRFAAAESVPEHEIPKAVSWMMLGGIASAILGPQIGFGARDLLPVPYLGGFLIIAGLAALAAILLFFLRDMPPVKQPTPSESNRSLRNICRDPRVPIAVGAAGVAFVIMTFVMTATPISMHTMHGHGLDLTKLVIQAHIIAMFLPSVFTGNAIQRWGIRPVLFAGLLLLLLCSGIGIVTQSALGYGIALILLGVGWNFLYVGGTSLLTRTYSPNEKFRMQGFNDTVVFSVQFLASFMAGAIVHSVSWPILNALCVPVILGYAWVLFRKYPGIDAY